MIKITIKTKQNINATNPPSKTNSLAIKTKNGEKKQINKKEAETESEAGFRRHDDSNQCLSTTIQKTLTIQIKSNYSYVVIKFSDSKLR
jgi:hypothetical protein